MRVARVSHQPLTDDCDHELDMKVLVVEDELKMASLLLRGFRSNGHAADVSRTGEDAIWMACARDYDAIVRRGPVERPTVLETGDLRLDPATRQVWRGTAEIELTAKEFALLEAFMRRPGEVLSRDYLLEQAWDMGYDNRSNVIAVYVNYLRDKIDRPFGARSLETVRGAGYRLRDDR